MEVNVEEVVLKIIVTTVSSVLYPFQNIGTLCITKTMYDRITAETSKTREKLNFQVRKWQPNLKIYVVPNVSRVRTHVTLVTMTQMFFKSRFAQREILKKYHWPAQILMPVFDDLSYRLSVIVWFQVKFSIQCCYRWTLFSIICCRQPL